LHLRLELLDEGLDGDDVLLAFAAGADRHRAGVFLASAGEWSSIH